MFLEIMEISVISFFGNLNIPLRANETGFISVSNFLSTSASREVALEFAREALNERKKVSVLMEFL